MHVIHARNVAEALPVGLTYLAAEGRWETTRAGRALVAPGPVATVYERPRERVLFSALRDANPFFHVAEACWMLAGRRDAAFLNNFVKDFGARFAEPGGEVHDAYGHRWRHAFGFDQLDVVVRQLSEQPESRQVVISMWDGHRDDYPLDTPYDHYDGPDLKDDLRGNWRTRPCNVAAFLRIRQESGELKPADGSQWEYEDVLDITVCCRSNDIVWGAYGANAVHFSVLQEYLAARLDVGVGTYVQFSNNYHCYKDQWNKLTYDNQPSVHMLNDNRYATPPGLAPVPLVHDPESFDEEVRLLLEAYESSDDPEDHDSMFGNFHNGFFSVTVWPMLMAHRCWRGKGYDEAASWLDKVEAPDWRVAATEWIQRRTK